MYFARLLRRRAPWLRALLPAVALVVIAAPVQAQYFGRNKVQYDRLDFRAVASEHFNIYYYPAESIATMDAARMAERWYARHGSLLQHEFDKNPLIFYADPPDFQQTNVIGGLIGQGTGGVTEGSQNRVIMPFTGVYAETDHVLGHELVHVFQYRIAEASQGGLQNLNRIPLWLIEGMAEYLSLGRDDPNTAMWLRDALRRDDLPTLDQLTTDPRYFPYRYGQALWAFIGGEWGDATVNRLYRSAVARGWEEGVNVALGMSADSLSALWHQAIRDQYGPTFAGRASPDSVGRAVIRVKNNGDQNVSPTVSPDGRYVAFFSSRDLFGMDLYLAETATGRIVRRLTSITSNPHFDALSFINSAGSFSPDGQQLAVVTFADGDNEINIFDVGNGDVRRRIRVDGVTAMADPAWSPDGRSIAFAGFRGGISDLYVYDLQSGAARQLTNGREAELQPAWSPDGSTIVFATDRGPGTDFSTLTYGDVRLATIAATGGDVRLLPALPAGKSINPQYAPDGQSIYFVSDQDGVSDVYRMDGAGQVNRVTRVATGVSGISKLSPTLSVARESGVVVFSVFDHAGFAIRALDASAAMGTPLAAATGPSSRTAGILPPDDALTQSVVERQLADAATGLASPSSLMPTKVDGGFHLDYIGGPSVGVSFGGGYGTGLGGGIALGFSDLLGNKELGVGLMAQGDIKDIGGSVYFLNKKRRWNWGAAASHTPYAGIFASYENVDFDDGTGQTIPGVVYVQELQRVYYDNVDLLLQYPFSGTRRFETSVGVQHIGFDSEVDSLFIVGNTVVGQSRADAASRPGLNFAHASAALVGDNSFFGFTSPVAGGRYRMELSTNIGDLDYQSALLDFRKYFFWNPITFAVRGVHLGRYGSGAESNLLRPLFLGQQQLIRGYDANSFSVDECEVVPGTQDACPQFSRLNGSRIAVANFELRIPLFGTDRFGLINLPFLPTEITPFFDAGVAWTKDESPELKFARNSSERVPVFSTGVSTRLNLFGYAVVEVFWAYPFQRPEKGGFFGFQLAPGW